MYRDALYTKEMNLPEYEALAKKWADEAWNAWFIHHDTVRKLCEQYKELP